MTLQRLLYAKGMQLSHLVAYILSLLTEVHMACGSNVSYTYWPFLSSKGYDIEISLLQDTWQAHGKGNIMLTPRSPTQPSLANLSCSSLIIASAFFSSSSPCTTVSISSRRCWQRQWRPSHYHLWGTPPLDHLSYLPLKEFLSVRCLEYQLLFHVVAALG